MALAAALEALDAAQREAVLAAPGSPLLVSAGAGSGKTRCLTMRIAALLEHHGVRAEQVLALTFTKKACGEMQERVQRLCPQIARHALTVKTFHAFCRDVVRDHHRRLGFAFEPSVVDAVAQADLIRECIEGLSPNKIREVRNWKVDESLLEGVPEDDGDSRKSAWSAQHNGLNNAIRYFVAWLRKSAAQSPVGDASQAAAGGGALMRDEVDSIGGQYRSGRGDQFGGGSGVSAEQQLKEAYEREKRRRVLIDFDDLIPMTLTLLKRDLTVRQQLTNRFQNILVDEFQDVSGLQFELLVALSDRHSPRLTACGDPDQSIYSFLNGNTHNNFEQFVKMWPASLVVKLKKNFRSDAIVVKAAAALISNNPTHATSTAAHCWTTNADGRRISVCSFASEEREVKWVCDQVEFCKRAGVPLRQMAVLFRLRSIGKAFQKECQKRKISAVNTAPEHGTPYRKAQAMDLLAYLKLALWDDDKAFARVLNKPKRSLGEQALEKVRQTQARFKCSLMQAARKAARTEVKGHLSAAQQKGMQAFLRVVDDLRNDVDSKSAPDVLKSLVQRVYCTESSAAMSKKKGKDEDLHAMTALVRGMIDDMAITEGLDDEIGDVGPGAAGARAGARSKTAQQLCKYVSSVSTLDTEGLKKMRESEVLTLSTIHQAKGLEFSHVWVVRFAEGVCPLRANLEHCEDEKQMEEHRNAWIHEERRIAYVAVTRAKHSLNISWLSQDHQSGEQLEPSRFVQEIPDECMQSAKEAAIADAGRSRLESLQAVSSASSNQVNSAAACSNSAAAYANAAHIGVAHGSRGLGSPDYDATPREDLETSDVEDDPAYEIMLQEDELVVPSKRAPKTPVSSRPLSMEGRELAPSSAADAGSEYGAQSSNSTKFAPLLKPSRGCAMQTPQPLQPTRGSNTSATPLSAPSSWGVGSRGAVLQPWLSGRTESILRTNSKAVSQRLAGSHAGFSFGVHGNSSVEKTPRLALDSPFTSNSSAETSGFVSRRPTVAAGRLDPRFNAPHLGDRGEESRTASASSVSDLGATPRFSDKSSSTIESLDGKEALGPRFSNPVFAGGLATRFSAGVLGQGEDGNLGVVGGKRKHSASPQHTFDGASTMSADAGVDLGRNGARNGALSASSFQSFRLSGMHDPALLPANTTTSAASRPNHDSSGLGSAHLQHASTMATRRPLLGFSWGRKGAR